MAALRNATHRARVELGDTRRVRAELMVRPRFGGCKNGLSKNIVYEKGRRTDRCGGPLSARRIERRPAEGGCPVYFFAAVANSFAYSPYPSASSRLAGMKRRAAEFMQ